MVPIPKKRCKCQENCKCFYWYSFKHQKKRYRKSTHTANYKLACRITERAYNDAVGKKAGVADAAPVTARLSDLCTRFTAWYAEAHPTSAHRCPSTLASFQGAFVNPPDPPIVDITTFDLERWRTARLKEVQRSSTQTDAFLIAAMFREAERFYPGFTRPTLQAWTLPDGKRRILEDAEIALALTQLPPVYALIGRVTLECLPRISEVLSLTRHDIGVTTGPDPVWWMWRRLKGGKRLRVEIPEALYTALHARLVRPGQLQLFEYCPRHGKRRGQWVPMGQKYASMRFTLGFRKLGLWGVTHHKFRHTAITLMLDGGENAQVIQELAGWTSLQMLKHYGQVRNAARRKAVRANADTVAAILEAAAAAPTTGRKHG